ncbi:MAG: NAD(P)(+) transhydrogenase (Re/Si-specific) subunit beta [Acidobacteria bacterium]|nr:NAD(P)(+) transhydrogenase (Re/Si-specific) subunit beta [Acidobacteriota bacterium]
MPDTVVSVAYLLAGVLFILSLAGLSAQATARRGNLYGITGMIIAVVVTAFGPWPIDLVTLAGIVAVGAVVGAILAWRVEMTAMPQLVAILHSFVGLAAVLVGISGTISPHVALTGIDRQIHDAETFLGVFIGSVTFTGSLIAYGKLQGLIRSKPLLLEARHGLNLAGLLACVALGVIFVTTEGSPMWALLACAAISGVLGIHLVMAIGGADMPVVVSMLNSYSGWAAASAGFMLSNDLLIITGALVGSSGAILSYIMCQAMNRSFLSVILGGFGGEEAAPGGAAAGEAGEVHSVMAPELAQLLLDAREVVIVPGYGMAVAQAQYPLHELTQLLTERGTRVRFAIHPVAGRLPGHMNVLLAEARVPYDIVYEMDEVNDDFPRVDLVMVVGANDIVNPGAKDDPSSPIYGMPVLEVWRAKTCVVSKRGMATGYAGVENPLFYKDNTLMLFGDARKSIEATLAEFRRVALVKSA